MEKAWYWKVALVVVLTLGSVGYLLPTFIPEKLPEWYTGFFNKRINLGLDLQGGIHLVLGVEVEKALEDKADQYVNDFRDALKENLIPYKSITHIPGTYDIQFELESSSDITKLRKRVLENYKLKVTEGTDESRGIVRVTFDPAYVNDLRKNARDQARMTIRNRIDEFGVSEPTIAPAGENGILVQIPYKAGEGNFDPERAKKLLGRTAQLEFKIVDDKSDFIQKLRNKLPEGIHMDSTVSRGPGGEAVTEYFLYAKGTGVEGKDRLMDFFNNVSEMEAFLKDKKVDPKTISEILELAKNGITSSEHIQIQKLALQVLGTPEEKAAGEEVLQPEPAPGPSSGRVEENKPTSKEITSPPSGATEKPKTAYAEFLELLKGKVPAGHEIAYGRKESQLETTYRTYYLNSAASLTGDYITDARVQPDPETGAPEVSLTFDRIGGLKFEKLTGEHVGERMAIVLEGEVNSAPVIQTRIGGGRARITLGAGRNQNETLNEANDLAVVLRAGALPAPIQILEERTVGPTMGEDALRQGTWALAIGFALTILFMAVYYGISGLIADCALLLNALFILAVMAALQATLTLPGMAGIVLTLGMAVDANVIINERIREELRLGKTPRAAVDTGYARAFWTIFDSNFTTLISGVVLWSYGSGPVQGFAVTLIIGLIASMFTAIFVTRVVMDWITIHRKAEKLSV